MYPVKSRINEKTYTVSVEPASEPVSLAEVKAFLKIDNTDLDTLLNTFILASRIAIERYLNQALITQTWNIKFDFFDNYYYIKLNKSPIQSITSITTYDADDSDTVFDSDNYYLDSAGGRIILKTDKTFPTDLRAFTAIEIIAVLGYGDDGTDVPEPIRQAIMNYVMAMNECRGAICEMPCICKTLLSTYKSYDFRS